MFDWPQLQRWKIDSSRLPPDSIVRNRVPSFWDLYKWHVTAIGAVCALQSILIVGLLLERAHRRSTERALQISQRELQELSGSLIGAQEGERRRIARELHDDFNQTLALITVEMEMLRQKLPALNGELRPRIEQLAARIQGLSSAIHELSHKLHPLALEQLGLVSAIRSLCKEVSQSHGLTVDFTADNAATTIPPDTALCLYRIVQESLRNVVRHSGAQRAEVILQQNKNAISLRIADAGSGFDAERLDGKRGLGFISMVERLRLVGGTIQIDSGPSRGTQIVVTVPLNTTSTNVQTELPAESVDVPLAFQRVGK
jgi:signal transduction histidine kinase